MKRLTKSERLLNEQMLAILEWASDHPKSWHAIGKLPETLKAAGRHAAESYGRCCIVDRELTRSVVVPMRVPFVTIVLVVTPIPIGVAHPMPATSIIMGRMVFRLTPADVAISVACQTNAMMAIYIAAFISARDGGCGKKDCRSREYNDSNQHRFYSY